MNLTDYINKIKTSGESLDFNETIVVIDANYNFTPTTFKNDDAINEAGKNSGSCKLFSFAQINQLTKQQTYVLNKLYKRLEEIPKSHPGDPKTKEKFDQLKTIYKQIAGENNLNANTLLTKIIEHEALNSKTLFTKRSPNFLSRLFSMSSTTERLFKQMKTELINTQSNLSNEDKSAADPKKPS